MTSNERVDAVLSIVRSEGGRATPARRAILQTLVDEQQSHPTAERITEQIQRLHPDVAGSTVYRFLDQLERLGVVEPIRVGQGATAYHLTEDARHHHLVCSSCGAMTEVPDRVLNGLRRALRKDHGFEIDTRHVTLGGLCAVCAARRRESRENRENREG